MILFLSINEYHRYPNNIFTTYYNSIVLNRMIFSKVSYLKFYSFRIYFDVAISYIKYIKIN